MSSSSTSFDYEAAASSAGYTRTGMTTERWIRFGRAGEGVFQGTPQELCFYVGIGPEWEMWWSKEYEMGRTNQGGGGRPLTPEEQKIADTGMYQSIPDRDEMLSKITALHNSHKRTSFLIGVIVGITIIVILGFSAIIFAH